MTHRTKVGGGFYEYESIKVIFDGHAIEGLPVISTSEAKAEAYPWRTVAVAYEGPAELEELSLYAAVARQGVEQAFDFEPYLREFFSLKPQNALLAGG